MTHAYRLPRAAQDRLETAVRTRKNGEAVIALATWLARFWSAPTRLMLAFPIDRRAISDRDDLGLTEAKVRGAIEALVALGFLDRIEPDAGKRYQRTETGLQRRALTFRFGPEFVAIFASANAAAQRSRGVAAPARRPVPVRPFSTAVAHNQSSPVTGVLMGETENGRRSTKLECLLAQLGRAVLQRTGPNS